MPEVHGDHLDVSAEERRFLRRTFHRFALPWLLISAALGFVTGSLPGWIEARPESGGAIEDPHQREELGAMRGELAALSQRLVGAEAALVKSRERLDLLEGRSGGASEGTIVDSEELARRFEAVTSRIATLESRAGEGGRGENSAEALRLDAQLAALAERVARIENEQGGARANAPADFERQ